MTNNPNMQAIEKASHEIQLALSECGVEAISKLPMFMQAVKMAQGIAAMRAALNDQFVQTVLMPLMGTKLGFLTDLDHDKDGRRYGLNVVRDCCIEAMLRGFNVVGNEFNIIAGGFYGAKAGWYRKVTEFAGLTHLVLTPGVPSFNEDQTGALVSYSASWRLDGKPMGIECQRSKEGDNVVDLRIPVRLNKGMGVDAALGKAERKLLFRIYRQVAGTTWGAGEGDADDAITTTGEVSALPAPTVVPEGTPEGRRISLGGKKNGKTPAEVKPPAEAQLASQAPAQQQAEPKRGDWVSPEDDGRVIT